MLDRFEGELGQPIDLRRCGYLFLLTRQEDTETFKANVALQHRLGVTTDWLDGDAVRNRLPLMRLDDVLGATWNPGEGLADPNGVVQGYIAGARRLGAKCLTDTEVRGIVVENGRIRAIQTQKGEMAAPILVNAAGPWASRIGEMAGVEIPVVPVRRQIAVTTPIPRLPADFPFVIDFARNLYFHREGPAILTGMSNLNESPGFNQQVDREWELVHFEAAMTRMPLLENAGITSRWAGLYEVSPDAHPILGKVDEGGGPLSDRWFLRPRIYAWSSLRTPPCRRDPRWQGPYPGHHLSEIEPFPRRPTHPRIQRRLAALLPLTLYDRIRSTLSSRLQMAGYFPSLQKNLI